MDLDTSRIDSLEFLKTRPIRLVKFDVEGAELLALNGASETFRRARPVCVFEWGDAVAAAYGARAGDMWKFWREREYSLCDVRGIPIKSEDDFARSSALQDVWNYVAVPSESPTLWNRIINALRSVWAALDDVTVGRKYRSHARLAFPKHVLTFGSPYEEASIDLHFTNQSSFAWLDLGDGFYEEVPSHDRFPSPVRIGLRWFTRDGEYVTEERRSLGVAGVIPGEEISANVSVYPYPGFTFLPPGEYRVTIGLVHEGITWFKDSGDDEIALRVRVPGAGFAGATARKESSATKSSA